MKLLYISVAVTALCQKTLAGAGANVNGCIQINTAPFEPFTVTFVAGASSDHCMNDRGSSSTITVSSAGLKCSSLGYVELKASSTHGDTCATDKSWWGTSYNTSTGLTGSTNSQWHQSHRIDLSDQSPNTYVCGAPALCRGTSLRWDGTGTMWIIYEPYGSQSVDSSSSAQSHQDLVENILEL